MWKWERIRELRNNSVLVFFAIAMMLYAVTYAVIGLSSKGNYYSGIVSRFFDYPYAMRSMVLFISYKILLFFNYQALLVNAEFIYNPHHGGIHMAYSCMGFGLMALWIAFIISCKPFNTRRKLLLILLGLVVINAMNILRVLVIFISHNKRFLGIEHHDLFNMLVHVVVILMGLLVINGNKHILSGS